MLRALRDVRARIADRQVFASARSRRRFLFHLALGLLVLVSLVVLFREYVGPLTDPRQLRTTIRGFGLLGPLVLVALQATQVVVAPVPGQVLAVVGGYLYGAWWGTLFNMTGITIGSAVAFWLARRFGRPYVEDVVHEDALATFDGIDDATARVLLFVAFLVPGLPDDALCFIGGLTRLPLYQLVAIAVLGRTPAFFAVNVVGQTLEAGDVRGAVLLAIGIVVVSVLGYHFRERLVGLFGG